ncbi:hypothetical protein OG897_25450 [Streptomyces sp. NBC_00237]|uniref:hypothetical protein n=1 Tax=Streptomyces sp. NBC_00237 TaxID=2975687 RepID=UPI00225A5481|nr:hypothetical protein [Streptomyces sp. NBC_00237]MCX5204789.1 hypothetical protein [Streptomyces sp. NBC_00237]
MSAPEREVEKPMTPAAPASAPAPAKASAPVSMSALLASCAAATAVSTPPRQARARDSDEGTAGQREAA